MKSFIVLLAAALSLHLSTYAQTVTGSVKNTEGKPVEMASVSLLKAKDSSIVKINAADKNGAYQFEHIAPGKYLVSTNSVGYTPQLSTTFELTDKNITVPVITLEKANVQLSGVTVTARKPMVEVKADRMVVNVEGTVNAVGNDGMDLLRRSPGVVIDKDDNISMAGKNGVEVYIDGKPSPLRGADLAAYLRSMQSANIESIELITNPSAKYEAAGNAGIINIKLKKDKSLGTNGNITAGYNVGVYSKYNGGFSLNHRGKKVNVFGSYNYSNGKYFNNMLMYRDQADSIFEQHGNMINGRKNHNFKTGLDYFLNSKNTIGIMVNGNISNNPMNSDGATTIAAKSTGVIDRILKSTTDIQNSRTNVNFNANYKYANSTKGRELNVDADYGFFNLTNAQYLPNIYYKADGSTELYRNVYRMVAPSDIDIYAFKADYEQRLGKGKLGLGGKVGMVETKNDFNRYTIIGNTEIYDRDRSNKFTYSENVNALYANYNRAFKNFTVQAGLRVEHTHSNGRATGERYNTGTSQYDVFDSSLKRNYVDYFPSASISYTKNPMSQWSLNYSRRIDRPRYEKLNPFEFKLNDYTYMKGNTELRPQYTNSIGITHTYKYRLTTTLNYSKVKDMFVQTFEPIENSKMFQTTRNLATQDVVSLNVSLPISRKSFMLFNNLTANYSHYNANFGNGRIIDRDVYNVQYFAQATYKLGKKKDWTAELSGLYLSPFLWEGIFQGKAMGFIDAGVQKTILKGNGTLKASVSDIFNTMRFNGEGSYAGVYNRVNVKWESQQVKLNFTYRFGSNQVKSARQRKTALEEESNRTNGGGSTPGQ